jgi:hypothetical protein
MRSTAALRPEAPNRCCGDLPRLYPNVDSEGSARRQWPTAFRSGTFGPSLHVVTAPNPFMSRRPRRYLRRLLPQAARVHG